MFRKFQKFESFPKSEVFKLKLTEIRNFVPNCIHEFHNTNCLSPKKLTNHLNLGHMAQCDITVVPCLTNVLKVSQKDKLRHEGIIGFYSSFSPHQ